MSIVDAIDLHVHRNMKMPQYIIVKHENERPLALLKYKWFNTLE